MTLDALDEQIVRALLVDGRASYGAIGAKVNLSAPAVKRRVDRLRARGVVTGFTARVEPSAIGWSTEAYVELFCNRRTSGAEILERTRTYPEVVEAFTVTGDADALLHVFAGDMQHFERVLTQISAEPFVARTRSVIVLSSLLRRSQTPREGDTDA
ncbi:DNA-binding Lrp family transcriptional regulator [Haloactinopolyspora alba]|uniref:DNA-binding Lrp family transcriptional regulator n=1 Tax=Haloactinopolyspora alba TaxID=648780 RepID=A0A2P8EFR0_9ACTN|nr:Lrp/AsnC family transcriptional regulator [Haloactinopolyspora alba]PSL08303.1 DNA-binding Lrp family transcriptional regulator [Haloactinopolyspora alba]